MDLVLLSALLFCWIGGVIMGAAITYDIIKQQDPKPDLTVEVEKVPEEPGLYIESDGYRCEDGRNKTESTKRCDTCRHEKSRWFQRCADCSDFKLWEGKTDE